MNITAQDLDRLLLAGENITFEVKTATNGVPKKVFGKHILHLQIQTAE